MSRFKEFVDSLQEAESTDVNDIMTMDYKRPVRDIAGATYNGTQVIQSYNNNWFPRIKQDILKLLKSRHASASAEEAYIGYIQSSDSFIVAFDSMVSGVDPVGNDYTSFGYVSVVFVVQNGMYRLDEVLDGFDSFYKPNNGGKMSYNYINKNRDSMKILDIKVN